MALARPRFHVPKKITLQIVIVTLRGRFGGEKLLITKIIKDSGRVVRYLPVPRLPAHNIQTEMGLIAHSRAWHLQKTAL